MDFAKAIRELSEEKQRLDRVIACLEGLTAQGPGPVERRGRKMMGEEERQRVSQRMKAYWAGQRRKNRS
jgi:hypothetical protein